MFTDETRLPFQFTHNELVRLCAPGSVGLYVLCCDASQHLVT